MKDRKKKIFHFGFSIYTLYPIIGCVGFVTPHASFCGKDVECNLICLLALISFLPFAYDKKKAEQKQINIQTQTVLCLAQHLWCLCATEIVRKKETRKKIVQFLEVSLDSSFFFAIFTQNFYLSCSCVQHTYRHLLLLSIVLVSISLIYCLGQFSFRTPMQLEKARETQENDNNYACWWQIKWFKAN